METPSEKRDRIRREAEADAFGPSKKAAEEPKKPEAKKPGVGERALASAGRLPKAAEATVKAGVSAGAEAVSGGVSNIAHGAAELYGAREDNGYDETASALKNLAEYYARRAHSAGKIIKGAVQAPAALLAAASDAAKEWVSQMDPRARQAEVLPGGIGGTATLVRRLAGETVETGSERDKQGMNADELAGHLAAAAIIAKGGMEKKPAAKKKGPAEERAAAQAEAEAKLKPKAPAEPQGNENFTGAPAMPEGNYRANETGWEMQPEAAPAAALPDLKNAGIISAAKGVPEDAAQMAALKADLEAAGYKPTEQVGNYGGTPEPSYFVPGAKLPDLQELGKKYNQESVIHNADLHYTTGGNAGKVRRPTGEAAFGDFTENYTELGGQKYSIPYDWEAPPEEMQRPVAPDVVNATAPEPGGAAADSMPIPESVVQTFAERAPAPREMTQPIEAVQRTEGMPGDAAEAQINAEMGVQSSAPQVQTMQEAAQAVEPAITNYGPPTAADYLRIRDEGVQKVTQARTENPKLSRRAQNDLMRQHLNENGILSQSQSKEIANRAIEQTEPIPTPSAEALKPEHINGDVLAAELSTLKAKYFELHDEINRLLGTGGEGTVGGGVPLRGDLSIEQLNRTGKAAQVVLNQMAHVGAAILVQVGKSFKAWAERMRQEFGDISDEVLKKLYPKAQTALQTLQDTFPEMLTPEGAREAYTRGKSGMLWYDKAPEELAARYGPENVLQAADVYAATSVNTSAASTNITFAEKAMKLIRSGERDGFDKPFTMQGDNMPRAMADKLNEIARGGRVTGPKIGPYADTLAGLATGQDAKGASVFIPVLDSWMGRGFKFAKPDERWSPNPAQRQYITKTIVDIANAEGVQPYQVQASMWVEFKRGIERDRVRERAFFPSDSDPFGTTPGTEFRPGWDQERLQREYDKINRAEVPFDQLLQRRLGPAIQAAVAGDTTPGAGDRLLSTKVMKALSEPGAIRDPEAVATTALQSAGLDVDTASGLVPKMWEAVKERLNSTDPEGAKFSKAGMGIDPLDLFRLFHKDDALPKVPFAVDASRAARDAVKQVVPDVDKALRADLREVVTEEQAASIKATSDASIKALSVVLDKDVWQPGELHAAAITAAALAEKARNAEARAGKSRSKNGPLAVKPITEVAMDRFAESVHENMSEPELYGKLRSMNADSQQRWLANSFRASNSPARFSYEGLKDLYRGLYRNELLSGISTLTKSAAANVSVFPWIVAQEALATQFGRFSSSPKRAMPGQVGQLWAGLWSSTMESWRSVVHGDIEGIKLAMEQEGQLHLMGGVHPETMLDHILNLGSAPSVLLGAAQTPVTAALRRGALFSESFRRVSEEALTNEKLQDRAKFQERVEELRRAPDEDMLKYVNDYAEKWSLTKRYQDVRGLVQQNGKLDTLGMVFLDPFASVGVNAASLAIEMHPVTALLSPEFRAALKEPGASRERALAGLALGLGVIVTGMGLAQNGMIDGPGPDDPSENQMWQASGHSPNTVRNPFTGKPAFSLKYLGVFGPLLVSAAGFNDVVQDLDNHSAQQSVFALGGAIAEGVKNAGFLDTYARIVTAIASMKDDGTELLTYLRDHIESGLLVFPGHIGLARDIDSFLKEGRPLTMSKYDNKDLVSQTWDLIKQEFTTGIPGYSEDAPMVRNAITGKVVPRMDFLGARNQEPNKVAVMIDYLGSAQSGLAYNIVKPRRSVGGSGGRTGPGSDASAHAPIPLDAWQYDRKLQLAAETTIGGKTLYEAMVAAIDSAQFQRHLEIEQKNANARREGWCANRMKEIYQDFEQRGEDLLLKEDKHLQWEIAKKQWDAEQLQSTRPREFPYDEPPVTQYPRPGQNTRK